MAITMPRRISRLFTYGESWRAALERRLATGWPAFVDCERRLRLEGPFLLEVLGQRGLRVLDAAMGIGCEAVFLAREGYDVIGNEISPNLRTIATSRARKEGVRLTATRADWRNLGATFRPGEFDAALLLGNSLCLLREQRERRLAAEGLRLICKPGAAVVVDERNFGYILGNRRAILAGHFRYSGRVMYCGRTVRGVPVSIDDDCVRFVYRETAGGKAIGQLDMHPFRRGELVGLFHAAGFHEAKIYSDFVPGYRDSADFYTYVFR